MNGYRSSPFSSLPPVVKNLLIINVIFYLGTNIFNYGFTYPWVKHLGVYYFNSPLFKGWQLFTYMFMHSPGLLQDVSTITHILFNMFALVSLGSFIENVLGSKRFLNFYLLTGLGALLLQMLIQAIEVYNIAGALTVNIFDLHGFDTEDQRKLLEIYSSPMLGASGAIFGILTAFGMLFPNAELFVFLIPIPVKAKYLMPVYVLIELFLGVAQFSGDSVAHFAHLGGALFGFILIKLWGIQRPGRYL